MSFKRKKVLAALQRRGVVILREGGDHTIVGFPEGPATAMPRHNEVNRFTVRGVVRQLGIEWTAIEREMR